MNATKIVYWPGQTALMCAEHAGKALYLAKVMGFELAINEIHTDESCLNCENEAKKQSQEKLGS